MAAGLAALVLAGCASSAPAPAAPTSTSAATAAPSVSPSAGPTRAPVRVDESLLAHLPAVIDGVPVEFSRGASAEAARNLDLGGRAESIAYAVAAGKPRPDLAIATVLGLRDDGLDEAAFRDLRDTYDAEVCRPEGGVAGNAEAEIDGRTVYIGTCAGGGRTHHVLLERSGTVISVYSVGEARLGEQLMAELRDP